MKRKPPTLPKSFLPVTKAGGKDVYLYVGPSLGRAHDVAGRPGDLHILRAWPNGPTYTDLFEAPHYTVFPGATSHPTEPNVMDEGERAWLIGNIIDSEWGPTEEAEKVLEDLGVDIDTERLEPQFDYEFDHYGNDYNAALSAIGAGFTLIKVPVIMRSTEYEYTSFLVIDPDTQLRENLLLSSIHLEGIGALEVLLDLLEERGIFKDETIRPYLAEGGAVPLSITKAPDRKLAKFLDAVVKAPRGYEIKRMGTMTNPARKKRLMR